MKTKRTIIYGILLSLVLSIFLACNDNDDSYSLSKFRIDIATVIPEGERAYSLLLDSGEKLWPAATAVIYTPKSGQRVFVNYTLLSGKQGKFDHYVKINDIWNILTKPVINLTEQNSDSIGNDPVKIEHLWIGNDYLNTEFLFNYGGIKPHAINMVINKKVEMEDTDTLRLELRHNAYNSTSTRLFSGFACFELKSFQKEDVDSIPIKVIVKDWDKEKEYKLIYKYNNAVRERERVAIPQITSAEYR